MAIQIDRIDDKADGFTVDFTVVNKYRRTFPVRPEGEHQLNYARAQVQSIVTNPVEKPDGVIIAAPAVVASVNEQPVIVDITPVPELVPVPETVSDEIL